MEAHKLKSSSKLELLESGQPPKEHLVSPFVDVMLMGGLGLVFFVGMHFFVDAESNQTKLSWMMFYLSFAVNFPHFMSSYLLIYGDYRGEILKNKKFIWAAIIAPVTLIAALASASYYSLSVNDPTYLGYATNLMFFLVGHHYVKQIYGCVMVASAKKKFYFTKLESRILWATMYSVWAMSFVAANSYTVNLHDFYGIPYSTLGLDVMWLNVTYVVAAIALLTFIGAMLKRYIDDGKVMPLSAWTAIVTIYAWYIPTLYHKHYFLMIPFFHSLQYLLFTNVFVKNKASQEAIASKTESERRTVFLKKFCSFSILALVSGYLTWDFIPKFLDDNIETPTIFGATVFMFAFQIFLNVHHYIIDNVIWRKDNSLMKKYL